MFIEFLLLASNTDSLTMIRTTESGAEMLDILYRGWLNERTALWSKIIKLRNRLSGACIEVVDKQQNRKCSGFLYLSYY